MTATFSVEPYTVSSHHELLRGSGIDKYVCWSRMQAEAGQTIKSIVARKERERLAGNGHFLWGVGNAPAVTIKALVRLGQRIPVVFSLMKTNPMPIDASPARILIWRKYIDAHGMEKHLPDNALVTSRGDSPKGPKSVHYALMCRSDVPLRLKSGAPFDHRAYRNATGTGAPVGRSQVTALLTPNGQSRGRAEYEINLNAWLAESYWVRLTDPLELSPAKIKAIKECIRIRVDDWNEFVTSLRTGRTPTFACHRTQLHLF